MKLGKASDFSLLDQNGKSHSLKDYLGKWIVLYFYPKDDTPGCTTEACSFRDSFHELENLNVVILGVSKDSVKSHKKFAEKYNLNFPILSDEKHEVIEKYHAWGTKKFMGREYQGILRITYLIDPKGNIAKIYEKVNPLVHAQEIVSDIKAS
ncbi:MAG TPA: thioredoxin-dependent thiol peroxidase [Patescibacteria group bacterium]|nr:thioredoxin-dependent thiol peroxidase [Patescibacteria group bacterium]